MIPHLPDLGECSADLMAQVREVARLEALEPRPLAQAIVPDFVAPAPPDPRLHSARYARGLRVLRVAFAEDNASPPPLGAEGPAPGVPSFPVSVVMASAPDLNPALPKAPSSVSAARLLPDFYAPNGWHAAIVKHLNMIDKFKAWAVVPMSKVHECRRQYGDDRVTLAHLVSVLVCKLDSAGDARAADILNKFRVAVADVDGARTGVTTYSGTVDDISDRMIAGAAPALGADQTGVDVHSAYFYGTPTHPDAGGRCFFVYIPTWLSDLFHARFPAFDASGRPNVLWVTGNMPGRCDAGRI